MVNAITSSTKVKDTDNYLANTVDDLVDFVNGEGSHAGAGLTYDLVDKGNSQTISGQKTFNNTLISSGITNTGNITTTSLTTTSGSVSTGALTITNNGSITTTGTTTTGTLVSSGITNTGDISTGTLTTNAPIFGESSKTTRTLLSYTTPDFVTLSGYVITIENRTGIQRSTDGVEQFKFLVRY